MVDAAAVSYRLKKLDRRVAQMEDALLNLGETDAGLLLAALQDYASLDQLATVTAATTTLQSAISALNASAASNAEAVAEVDAATAVLISNEAIDDATVSQLQASVAALTANQTTLGTTVTTHGATLDALAALQTTVTNQQAQISTLTSTITSMQTQMTAMQNAVWTVVRVSYAGQNLVYGSFVSANGGKMGYAAATTTLTIPRQAGKVLQFYVTTPNGYADVPDYYGLAEYASLPLDVLTFNPVVTTTTVTLSVQVRAQCYCEDDLRNGSLLVRGFNPGNTSTYKAAFSGADHFRAVTGGAPNRPADVFDTNALGGASGLLVFAHYRWV